MKKSTAAPALSFRPFTEQDALIVARWRYPEPYAAYDLDPWNRDVLAALLRAENQYYAILRGHEVIGFYCLGEDARVPGWSYDGSALDLGMGLRPELTGKGQGAAYLEAVVAQVTRRRSAVTLRTTIASWNQRALRLCLSSGFREIARFVSTRSEQTQYVVLTRPG
jgi:[ribosomal protein S18]-alanine N-acetyltransferase